MPNLVENGLVFLEKIFNFVNVFSPISLSPPLKRGMTLNLNKLKNPLSNNALPLWEQSLVFNVYWPRRSGEDFYLSSMNFRYFSIVSPWKTTWPFI